MKQKDKSKLRADPLIDEVRQIRKAIEDEVGGDIFKLAEHYRRVGQEFRDEQARRDGKAIRSKS